MHAEWADFRQLQATPTPDSSVASTERVDSSHGAAGPVRPTGKKALRSMYGTITGRMLGHLRIVVLTAKYRPFVPSTLEGRHRRMTQAYVVCAKTPEDASRSTCYIVVSVLPSSIEITLVFPPIRVSHERQADMFPICCSRTTNKSDLNTTREAV